MAVANSIAYYNTATLTVVKSLIVLAPGLHLASLEASGKDEVPRLLVQHYMADRHLIDTTFDLLSYWPTVNLKTSFFLNSVDQMSFGRMAV
jgi:hypothetical protein